MRRVARLAARPLIAGGAAALILWAVGLTAASALLIGLALAVGVLVLERVEPDADAWRVHEHEPRRHGSRGEVQDLAWAMVARDGRVGERAHRVLRATAAVRLARHGIRLDEPADDTALRGLLGDRAHRTLTTTSLPLPRLADVRHTVGVLEGLGGPRAQPVADASPDPRAQQQHLDRTPAPGTPGRTVR